MMLAQIDINTFIGFVSLIVTALTGCVGYLFKLYYIDSRRHHAECKEQLKEAKKDITETIHRSELDCEKRISRYQGVIDHLQRRFDMMQNKMFGIDAKLVQVTDSAIHKSHPLGGDIGETPNA